jgi:hypothetical protein
MLLGRVATAYSARHNQRRQQSQRDFRCLTQRCLGRLESFEKLFQLDEIMDQEDCAGTAKNSCSGEIGWEIPDYNPGWLTLQNLN